MHTYFKLYATCLITKGANRSLILDLQRETSELIPNDLAEVIERLSAEKTAIQELPELYGTENAETIREYFDFLIAGDFGHYCDDFDWEHLPLLNTTYRSPEAINNAIVELDETNLDALPEYCRQLEEVGCNFLTLFVYAAISGETVLDLVRTLDGARFTSLELYWKYPAEGLAETIYQLDTTSNKLATLVVYQCPAGLAEDLPAPVTLEVVYLEQEITGFNQCGVIHISDFSTSQQKVLESLDHNSCLHKKVAIDRSGNIRNCPALPGNFGNTKDTTIREAIAQDGFRRHWSIKKDDITTCKDCEFRHNCTDCRAFTEDPEDVYSKPLKCGYDPYTNEWADWSTHPMKQKAIAHYGL